MLYLTELLPDPLFRQGIFGQGPQSGQTSSMNHHLYKNLPLQLQNDLLLGNSYYGQQAAAGLYESVSIKFFCFTKQVSYFLLLLSLLDCHNNQQETTTKSWRCCCWILGTRGSESYSDYL